MKMEEINCEFLLDDGCCRAILENEEGSLLRSDSCINEIKERCCYLCKIRVSCEIACNYLVKPEDTQEVEEYSKNDEVKYREKIKNLSLMYAKDRIDEQTYLDSVKTIEEEIDKLKNRKKILFTSPEFHDIEQSLSSEITKKRTHYNAKDFVEWAYSTFKNDVKYRKHLDRLELPSKNDVKNSQVSSLVGEAVSKAFIIGWQSVLSASIFFKDHPIKVMNAQDHKEVGKQKVRFFFSTIGATQDDVKKMTIKPIKKGIIGRSVVGIEFDFDCVGKEIIKKDKELSDKLIKLFQTQDLCNISNWTNCPITVEIARNDNLIFGKIEVGISQLNEWGLKLLLDIVSKMGQCINLELTQNRNNRL